MRRRSGQQDRGLVVLLTLVSVLPDDLVDGEGWPKVDDVGFVDELFQGLQPEPVDEGVSHNEEFLVLGFFELVDHHPESILVQEEAVSQFSHLQLNLFHGQLGQMGQCLPIVYELGLHLVRAKTTVDCQQVQLVDC